MRTHAHRYLYDHLLHFLRPFPNAWCTHFRLGTVWGAANLYEMYLRGMQELLPHDWDYFVNLSGADLPLRPIGELADFLGRYRDTGVSFLKSHGKDHKKFIRKQVRSSQMEARENARACRVHHEQAAPP